MVNILNNRIFLNGGIGVLLIAGIAIRIQGNTIETNKKAGILIGTSTEGLSINGNYFEANSENGITFETPNILIQGDIFINASSRPVETIASAYPVTGGSIKNNTFSYTGGDTVIQLIGAKNINIENNTEHALKGLKNLVSTNGNTERYITENIKISNNIGFKKQLNVTDILPYRQMRLSSYEISNTPKRNFFKDDYIIISSLSGGTISDSDLLFDGLTTKVITGVVGSSDILGFKIDISDYPSLKNKTLYFGAYLKASRSTLVGRLFSGAGNSSQSSIGTTDWKWVEYQVNAEESGILNFGISLAAAAISDTLHIAKPVLSLVRVPKENYI